MGGHALTYPHVRRPSRWRDVRLRYGVTREGFEALLETQRGLCAVCQETLETPHIDHDHENGMVRGLVCRECNLGIGHFRDDPRILYAAAAYVAKNRSE